MADNYRAPTTQRLYDGAYIGGIFSWTVTAVWWGRATPMPTLVDGDHMVAGLEQLDQRDEDVGVGGHPV